MPGTCPGGGHRPGGDGSRFRNYPRGPSLDWDLILKTIAVIGAVAAAVPYAIGTYRRSRDQASSETLNLQAERIGLLESEVERLRRDDKLKDAEIHKLTGRLEQMARENTDLRALVMGEKVPAALEEALTGIANRIIKRIEENEDRISEGVLAMTNGITTAMSRLATSFEAKHQLDEPKEI